MSSENAIERMYLCWLPERGQTEAVGCTVSGTSAADAAESRAKLIAEIDGGEAFDCITVCTRFDDGSTGGEVQTWRVKVRLSGARRFVAYAVKS